MTTVKNIYDYINSIAPFETMEDWDNSGFLAGDLRKEVKTVVLSLDAAKETALFAKSVDAQLLLTHHPLIFNRVKSVKKDTAIYTLINSDIAVISSHTPFDKAKDGINDSLAALLKLENIHKLDSGYLVVGELNAEMSIDDFALFVGETLGSHGLRYTDTQRLIKRVAVGGGACSEFMSEAMENADCFVTGDLKYHEMLDAHEDGFAVISAGHFETENAPFLMLKEKLEKVFPDVEFVISPVGNPVMEL